MSHQHEHQITNENERKTLWVIVLTIITMAAEIAYGYWSHSMALLADGYHMGTHALALGLTYAAYVLMRRCAGSAKFPCGTEKIGTLAAYTSALFLGIVGLWIIKEAVERFFHPLAIQFNEALAVAIIGLAVNAACIWIMERGHTQHPESRHHDKDYNFKAAYYHILADALTSILAIAALLAGKYTGLVWMDAVVGGLGGLLIIKWAANLIKHTVKILIDMQTD